MEEEHVSTAEKDNVDGEQPRPDQVITDNNEERNEAGDILPVENPPPADHHLVDKDAEATLNAMLDKIENDRSSDSTQQPIPPTAPNPVQNPSPMEPNEIGLDGVEESEAADSSNYNAHKTNECALMVMFQKG
uniref:Uncharacterized protein n=1 Tax=Pristionchus pacificus TaxID=54126 RepID=A0A2A6B3F9_PRIPA